MMGAFALFLTIGLVAAIVLIMAMYGGGGE